MYWVIYDTQSWTRGKASPVPRRGDGAEDDPGVRGVKVLQIHNRHREAGGEDAVAGRERALLESAGHRVIEYQTQNPTGIAAAAFTLLLSPWNPMSARRILEVVSEHRPDVVHIHNTWWKLSPSIIGALSDANVPVVMTLHNYRLLCANAMLFRDGKPCEDCVGTHPWRAVQHRCYRNSTLESLIAAAAIELPRRRGVWEDVDLLLPLTEFARGRFVAGGVPPEKLLVKPNFVDDPGPRAGAPSGSDSVLYVGRLSEEKGIRLLLDAWRLARPKGLELLVVGDGPLADGLGASVPPGVRLLGGLEHHNVRELMIEARALLFPSIWYEGQPMVVLESLAAGLPLVASKIGGIPETIADREAAILVPPGDRSEWADSILRLEDDSWVDTAGERSRSVFESRYSAEHALNGLMTAYGAAIAAHAR
jgi:glycosyltransferase involved in cell wall biosynthesis